MTSNASANDLKAALISPGTGTAFGLDLPSDGLGLISLSAAKNDERSGRLRRRRGVEVPVVECSTIEMFVLVIKGCPFVTDSKIADTRDGLVWRGAYNWF